MWRRLPQPCQKLSENSFRPMLSLIGNCQTVQQRDWSQWQMCCNLRRSSSNTKKTTVREPCHWFWRLRRTTGQISMTLNTKCWAPSSLRWLTWSWRFTPALSLSPWAELEVSNKSYSHQRSLQLSLQMMCQSWQIHKRNGSTTGKQWARK